MEKRGPYNDLNTDQRVRFWDHMIARHPGEERYARRDKNGMRWHKLLDGRLIVSLAIGIDFVRIFVRGDRGSSPSVAQHLLESRVKRLSEDLGVPLRSSGESDKFFSHRLDIDMNDENNWDRAADFLHDTSQRYERVLTETLGGGVST
jgi:hypothetical protein